MKKKKSWDAYEIDEDEGGTWKSKSYLVEIGTGGGGKAWMLYA